LLVFGFLFLRQHLNVIKIPNPRVLGLFLIGLAGLFGVEDKDLDSDSVPF